MTFPSKPARVWFITGSSTGLGRALVELILERNEIVVATLRTPSVLDALAAQYGPARLLVLPLDVTDRDQVTAAFSKARETFGRIDVVVNNAAFLNLGEIESVDEAMARSVLETNFWGALSVTKEAVRFFRDDNPTGAGGHLLQISSMLGLSGSPGMAFYVASKFALEGMTESLAMELDPKWNIKITLIEPGYVVSEVVARAEHTWSKPHPAYEANTELPVTKWRHEGRTVDWKDTRRSIELFYKVADLQEPPFRLFIGRDAIAATREKLASVTKTLDEHESWSVGLEVSAGALKN